MSYLLTKRNQLFKAGINSSIINETKHIEPAFYLFADTYFSVNIVHEGERGNIKSY